VGHEWSMDFESDERARVAPYPGKPGARPGDYRAGAPYKRRNFVAKCAP
jgi:hypothetical protein